jgi:hypothetical protein
VHLVDNICFVHENLLVANPAIARRRRVCHKV